MSKLKAVIYARYSSANQRDESIEGQIRECREYAERNNMLVIREYADRALTGTNDKRPEFQKMMKDSERKIFDIVICWKIDRFARNRYDSATYKSRLKKNNVKVHYAKESIPEGPEGIILESVLEGYAEYYSENLSQNVKRGQYESALKFHTLGSQCLGLRTGADGCYEIEPIGAAAVRMIFELYASGVKSSTIIRQLNEQGYRTLRGALFNANSITRIISNEKYIGVYSIPKLNYRVEDVIPAIIDKELFQKANAMKKQIKKSPNRSNPTDYLLTGKLFCGHCGYNMIGDCGTGKSGRIYYYYTCNKHKGKTCKCKKKPVKKDYIESLVINLLVKCIHSDKFIYTVADKVMAFQAREKENSYLNALEQNLKATKKALSNIMKAIEMGIITASTKNRLDELEKEEERIKDKIASEKVMAPLLTREHIIYFLTKLRDGDIQDKNYHAMLIDIFVNKIYLYDDHFKLILNYSGNNNEITKELAEKAFSGGGDVFGFDDIDRRKKDSMYFMCILSFFIAVLKGLERRGKVSAGGTYDPTGSLSLYLSSSYFLGFFRRTRIALQFFASRYRLLTSPNASFVFAFKLSEYKKLCKHST